MQQEQEPHEQREESREERLHGEQNSTPLSAEHPFTEQLMSAASLDAYRLSSNRRKGGKKTTQSTGALLDLDYSTQAAKYINLATVEKPFSRQWSISQEVCCIIRARNVGYT